MGLIESTAHAVRAAANNSSGELALLRERTLTRIARQGIPHVRDEDWKYTDLASVASHDYAQAGTAQSALAVLPLASLRAHRLVFVDGRFAPAQSSALKDIPGVTVSLLHELAQHAPAALAARLAPQADAEKTFVALNAVTARDGLYLEIDDEADIAIPLLLLFVTTAQTNPHYVAPLIHLSAGQRSRACIIEMHQGPNEHAYLTNTVTQITTAASASLTHYRVVAEGDAGAHIGQVSLDLGANSTVRNFSLALAGKLIRVDIDCTLASPGSKVTLDGIFTAGKQQHIDHHTRVDHKASDTVSAETYKGIASGNGRGVFNGKVIVHAGTQRIVAEQSSNNLLLSADAEIDTKPELEIYADDLRCAHGATVGQLDENALFYLRARGVPEAQARALLTFGFVQELVETIDVPLLRAFAAQRFAVENPDLASLLDGVEP